jgi:hypothetical protein
LTIYVEWITMWTLASGVAALAILVAPQTPEESRQAIRQRAEERAAARAVEAKEREMKRLTGGGKISRVWVEKVLLERDEAIARREKDLATLKATKTKSKEERRRIQGLVMKKTISLQRVRKSRLEPIEPPRKSKTTEIWLS